MEEYRLDGRFSKFVKGDMDMINDKAAKLLEFPVMGDERGRLVVVEGNISVPFEIKRLFYIYGTGEGVVRGKHANLRTEFVLINVAGESKVRVLDGKGNEVIFHLKRPHTGIYLPNMVWKEMFDFSSDSVLLVLASEHYDNSEYIRDYKDFEKSVAVIDNNKSM